MSTSVNTNYSAMIALQNLNETSAKLDLTQNRINTGLRISGPKDNGAVWAIAQTMRMDIQALNAVTSSLNRAMSVADTAVAAGTSISELLKDMKEKALAARDPSIDQNSRDVYNAEFIALRDQISKVLENAAFDGSNLLNGSVQNVQSLANADGNTFLTVTAQDLSLSGTIVTLTSTATISTAAQASVMITTIQTSLDALNLALSRLGTDAKKVETHKNFIAKLTDELQNGVGHLVDADLAKESAMLQSLQVKQQLGVQALSIANSAPQVILSLFRG
jgi:flagellin